MSELPLTPTFTLIGGVRFEDTAINTLIMAEDPQLLIDVGVDPDNPNVNFEQSDVLPSIGFSWDVTQTITFRGAYAETIARQTFRELAPVLQQEYLGADIFVGNPDLLPAALKNYDLRLDYEPTEGSLFSISYFYKQLENPIEYVQKNTQIAYTQPTNYPEGQMSGFEFEIRQELGKYNDWLNGLSIGGNATLIDSQVTISEEDKNTVRALNSSTGANFEVFDTRDAVNAPEYLYNIFLLYNYEPTGTDIGIFYTVRGDTLAAGAGVTPSGYIPDVYETEYGTLNFSITQKLGQHFQLRFQAKNLTDPEIQEVYRFLGNDTVKSSYTKGIDLSIGFSAKFEF
jgi:TonB-dependent receptor